MGAGHERKGEPSDSELKLVAKDGTLVEDGVFPVEVESAVATVVFRGSKRGSLKETTVDLFWCKYSPRLCSRGYDWSITRTWRKRG